MPSFLGLPLIKWLYVFLIYFSWITVLLIVKKFTFNYGQIFSRETKGTLDDIIFDSLNIPLILVIISSGFIVVEKFMVFGRQSLLDKYFNYGFLGLVIIALVLFLDNLTRNIIKVYSGKIELLKVHGSFAQFLIRFIILSLGGLVLLNSLGISITPFLAYLGIGSLPIFLALQQSLENFFASIQILIDKPVKVGQFIKLETGEEGYVDKIGWRSTWIRQMPDNMIIVPNKMIASSRILNYYYPFKEMAVLVEVGVDYSSDLDFVEKVTREVAEEVLNEVAGSVSDFKPIVRFHTFGEYSINFTVVLRCHEFADSYSIKHEFIKKLSKRYKKEGITIPYPIKVSYPLPK